MKRQEREMEMNDYLKAGLLLIGLILYLGWGKLNESLKGWLLWIGFIFLCVWGLSIPGCTSSDYDDYDDYPDTRWRR